MTMMSYIYRPIEKKILEALERKKSVLLLGPRQTGKTTIAQRFNLDLQINLMDANKRQQYESQPGSLIGELQFLSESLDRQPLVFIDEIQKVPELMDALQVLIDTGVAQFIISGSSARQIRNLLPGRVIRFQMDPLSSIELHDKNCHIEQQLVYGTLPGIVNVHKEADKELELKTYVSNYLEEEIRKESLVRNLAAFSQFLHLACIESGHLVSFRAISQEIGVSHSTIAEYYRILEDCMLVERIDPITKSESRKRLTKSSKYIVFDMGVRRVGAKEGNSLSVQHMAHLFEQWVGLELKRISRLHLSTTTLSFWRDHAGPEVDWVLQKENEYLPIEVKWTQKPKESDCRHIHTFMNEYSAKKGIIVCRCSAPLRLSDRVIAIPWHMLAEQAAEWILLG